MKKLTITKPDDWHVHLRDHTQMAAVVQDTAKFFKRALVMPNLMPPIISVEMALAYKKRILQALPGDTPFEPKMALYLTASTSPQEIIQAKNKNSILAIKLFPAGATTNSAAGIQHIDQCVAVFEKMEEIGMPLSVHGEVTDPDVDIFDREKVFIDRVLEPLRKRYPQLKIVLEHLTSKEGVQYVQEAPPCLAATITIHHLLLNRNDLLVGGIKPHYYCLPIVKGKKDQEALIKAATSGNPKFFLGTDSAPHAQTDKETAIAKAGIYTTPVSLPLYLKVFEQENQLEGFEAFASFNGADFYGLPRNREQISFIKSEMIVPAQLPYGEQSLIPLMAGSQISWIIDPALE